MPVAQYRVGREDGPPDFFLATTSGSGRPCGNYTMSIADTMVHLGAKGLAADYWLHCGDCHVDDARNFMVRQFLMSGAPVLVFIDDDVGWDAADLIRIVKATGDVVGGCYPLKQDREDYPLRIRADLDYMQARDDGLLEVEGVPTGFMAIKRKVLEAMSERRKYMSYNARGFSKTEPQHPVIFERMTIGGNRWSGDLNFCREVREIGFKVFVDPEMSFTHEGSKRWRGHLGNWLRNANGIMRPELDKAFKRLMTGETDLKLFEEIWRLNGNSYAASAEMCHKLFELAPKAEGPILELGSGLTTLSMAIAVQRTGQIVHTLEHDFDWFRATRKLIRRYALRPVHLYYAPIQEHGREDLAWYEIPPELPDKFAMVVIDGPPRKYSRSALFELMGDRVKDAVWVVDDTDDSGVVEMINKHGNGRPVEYLGGPRPLREYAVSRPS
jgi:hypothetical protein